MVVPSSGRARRSTDIFDPPLERHAASLLEDRPRRDALLSYTSYAMVAIGAALRLTQYLTNRSLSFDEALLALNIIQKSPRALLGELSFDQAAPLGFLEAEKLATAIFGRSEYALRLFPLLVSLLSLVAFYWAARKLLNGIAVPLALAAFALLEPLIYYSATAKQYAIDVAVAVLLFGIGAALRSSRLDTAALMMLTATGAVAVWFSHASVFVLAPLGLLLAYQAFRGGDRNRFLQLLLCFALWVLSLGIEFALSRSNIVHIREAFLGSRHGVFLGGGSEGPTWFDTVMARVRYFSGLEETTSGRALFGPRHVELNQALTLLVLAFATLGFLSLVLRGTRKALLLTSPAAFLLLASALGRYPLVGRTLLFLLVPLALAFGEGGHVAISAFRSRRASTAGGALVLAALAVIAILPTLHLAVPRRSEELKPVLNYLERHRLGGDALYVAYNAQYAVAYYHLCSCGGFDPERVWPFEVGGRSNDTPAMRSGSRNLIVGSTRSASGEQGQDLKPFLGRPRVWILVADLPSWQLDPLLRYADAAGRRLDSFSSKGPKEIGASIYLYDLER